jgi:hypothetical protein
MTSSPPPALAIAMDYPAVVPFAKMLGRLPKTMMMMQFVARFEEAV